MKTVTATPSLVLPLGRMGENEYTRIQFDVSGWLNELPDATIGLYNQRPQDADAYPVDGITVEDGIVTWTITSAELAQVGKGRCELVAIENNVVAKSAIYNTIVFDALDGSGDAPSPWDSWQETFVALKAEAVAAAQDAEEAVEHYPRIVNGIWQVWDVQTGAWVSTGVHATGADGQDGADGVSPTVSVTDISGGHRVTITDAEGQHTFDVLNGEDGTDGTDGQDGFSPSASVTQTATGATISITDKQGTTTANIENGTDGTDGTDAYVYIRYSAAEPTQDSDMKTTPDAWIGIYSGDAASAPTHYTDYVWYKIKGETGAAGVVQDVQVYGTSIVENGVANIPKAAVGVRGVVKLSKTYGVQGYGSGDNEVLGIIPAGSDKCKVGTEGFNAIVPSKQHESVYYGLAKAAGADMRYLSGESVGVYPEAQKSAISTMLSAPVSVTGTTPTITALSGIQYVCGEVSTLDITLPASGIVDVVFTSGSTPTVLTVTPQTGMTVEWANGFDSTSLEADTLYELNIRMVGTKCLGVAGQWG